MKTQESKNPSAPPKDNNLNSTLQQLATLDSLPEILTADMISRYLQVNYGKALQLIKFGGIPHLKLGNTYRVPKVKFQQWINESSHSSNVPQ